MIYKLKLQNLTKESTVDNIEFEEREFKINTNNSFESIIKSINYNLLRKSKGTYCLNIED